MPLPEPVRFLISQARRRLLLMDMVQRVVLITAVVAVLAAAAIGVARFVAAPWVEPAALAALIVGWLTALAWSFLARPSLTRSAIEADQRMGGFDRVSTALELTGRPTLTEPEVRQVHDAGRWASNRPLTGFDRFWPAGPLVPLAILGLAATLVLALVPSPADAVVEQLRIDEALIEEAADTLQEQAEELTPELQEQLEALIDELRQAEDLEQAIAQLGEARQQMAEQADPLMVYVITRLEIVDSGCRVRSEVGDGAGCMVTGRRAHAAVVVAQHAHAGGREGIGHDGERLEL